MKFKAASVTELEINLHLQLSGQCVFNEVTAFSSFQINPGQARDSRHTLKLAIATHSNTWMPPECSNQRGNNHN